MIAMKTIKILVTEPPYIEEFEAECIDIDELVTNDVEIDELELEYVENE